jgi:hypothetical protein
MSIQDLVEYVLYLYEKGISAHDAIEKVKEMFGCGV